MQVVIRYIIKNKNTGALHHKIYNIELIESNGLSNLFDIENYVIISRDLQTGLTDKNGVKVFEGDVLKSNMYNKKWIVDFTPCDGLKLAIKYEDDFKINGIVQTHEDWSYNKISSCEIIGNIYK